MDSLKDEVEGLKDLHVALLKHVRDINAKAETLRALLVKHRIFSQTE